MILPTSLRAAPLRQGKTRELDWPLSDRLIGALDVFVLAATIASHVRRALQVQRLLAAANNADARSHTSSSRRPRVLHLTLLHYDSEFIGLATGQ